MVTLISFILLILGAANWMCIGLMQYDFIAGFFGTQSSFLSRTIYIIVGFAAIWMIIMAFKQRGRIKINDNGFSKKEPLEKSRKKQVSAPSSVELDEEIHRANRNDNPFENQWISN